MDKFNIDDLVFHSGKGWGTVKKITNHEQPISVYYEKTKGCLRYTPEGKHGLEEYQVLFTVAETKQRFPEVPVPKTKKRVTKWLNLYPDDTSTSHSTEEIAKSKADVHACSIAVPFVGYPEEVQ